MKTTPIPVLKRLPMYYDFLANYYQQGGETISCTQIADHLNLTSIQVRKDMAFTGIIGKPKVGYVVTELQQKIANFLGWNNINEAFLVGVGHLGNALLSFEGFSKLGFKIVAGFDADSSKIDSTVHGIKIMPISKFKNLAQRMKIHIGIITTPALVAQETADIMVDSGILAIWNFTDIPLKVPESVIVQQENLASSLSILSNRLSKNLKGNAHVA